MLTGFNPNRTFSAVFQVNKGTPAFQYVWSPYAIAISPNGGIQTGAMVPAGTNTFTPVLTGIIGTGNNLPTYQIPITAKAFSIWTVSGVSTVNNISFFPGQLYQGGQYDGNQTLSSPMTISISSGGLVNIEYET